MKVFNLACRQDHRFEGWFASADDFDSQHARGLIECPICAGRTIRKLPSAPRLNLSGASAPVAEDKASPPARGAEAGAPTPEQVHAMLSRLARHVIENTEDVGEKFAEEARRIHYNETPERGIRGVATAEERAELADEGIEVFSLPLPNSRKGPLQ
ncbi:MAG: DUF1178 family protein [Burkholderiaceae bacterium]